MTLVEVDSPGAIAVSVVDLGSGTSSHVGIEATQHWTLPRGPLDPFRLFLVLNQRFHKTPTLVDKVLARATQLNFKFAQFVAKGNK
jgi:hypothetical protein